MRNLLIAGLRQLFRHNPLSIVTLTAAILSGAAAALFGKIVKEDGISLIRPDIILYSFPILFLLLIFSVIRIVGQEQSSGTIRNKLISGYTKASVCSAWLLLTAGFSLLTGLLYLGTMYLLGRTALSLLGSTVLIRTGLTVLLIFLIAGVLTAVLSLHFRRQIAAAGGIVGLTALLVLSAVIVRGKIEQPEYVEYSHDKERLVPAEMNELMTVENGTVYIDGEPDYHYTLVDGVVCCNQPVTVTSVERNPFYLASPARETCICLNRLNPADALFSAGQSMMSGVLISQQPEYDRFFNHQTETLKRDLADAERRGDPAEITQLRNSLSESRRKADTYRIENANEIAYYSDETHSLPQCMLALLLIIPTAGILLFKRRNII